MAQAGAVGAALVAAPGTHEGCPYAPASATAGETPAARGWHRAKPCVLLSFDVLRTAELRSDAPAPGRSTTRSLGDLEVIYNEHPDVSRLVRNAQAELIRNRGFKGARDLRVPVQRDIVEASHPGLIDHDLL